MATSGRGALGSAVVMDPAGYLVTNWHVVRDAAQIRVQLADGRVAVPELVGADPDTELALLKIDLPDLPSIRTSSSDALRVGQIVLAIGNSLGLSQTVTMGIVSATGRGQLGVTTFEDFIQTDAAINIGNSGGALINAAGELVGINTAVISRAARGETPPEGIGFAIPVNLVRGVMEQLIAYGRVIRGYLGIIQMSEISDAAGQLLGLDGPAIQVLRIDGPARAAGLESGDILTHLNDDRIVSRPQLMNLVARAAPGGMMRIRGIKPDGAPIDTTATLAEREGLPGS
jgi:serine protease DegS